jgi:hypothetical protein
MNKLLEEIGKEIVNLALCALVFAFIMSIFFISVTDMDNRAKFEAKCIEAGNQVISGDCVK